MVNVVLEALDGATNPLFPYIGLRGYAFPSRDVDDCGGCVFDGTGHVHCLFQPFVGAHGCQPVHLGAAFKDYLRAPKVDRQCPHGKAKVRG